MLMTGSLSSLGINLVSAHKRLFPQDSVRDFAVRIGVSTATYQKMRKGDLTVSIGKYHQAAQVLGLENGFKALFEMEDSLFDD